MRSFCGRCGSSPTFSNPRASVDEIEIAPGAFDDPLPIRPDAHIFVDSKADSYVLDEFLPVYLGRRRTAVQDAGSGARIAKVKLVVKDYDEAIEVYSRKLRFTVTGDEVVAEQNKR